MFLLALLTPFFYLSLLSNQSTDVLSSSWSDTQQHRQGFPSFPPPHFLGIVFPPLYVCVIPQVSGEGDPLPKGGLFLAV